MCIFNINIDILMCSDFSLEEESARTIFKSHIFVWNWGFFEHWIWPWELCFFEVNVLSKVEKIKLWESYAIDSKFKIHNIHSLYNIINSPSSIFIIRTCEYSLTDFKWHFITDCANESIWVCDSIIW